MRAGDRLSSGDADLRIGLPETKLGIMPGFGGLYVCHVCWALTVRWKSLPPVRCRRGSGAENRSGGWRSQSRKLIEGAMAILRQAINGDLD